MPEAELDECRPYLSFVDRTARQGTSSNNRRKQGLKASSRRCSEAGAIIGLPIARQLATPPMRVLTIRAEDALDVSI